jgi:hypothetical protein
MRILRLITLPLVAAALLLYSAQVYSVPVISAAQKERSAFSTANPIPLCLPHARGCDLKETWDMSEVQNEIS